MEITSSNFDQSLPVVERSIQTADFITFDTEFSGYTACDDDKGHDYDTMEERYQKMKKICSSFIAFQFGICTFKWDEELKKYKARPFCFYVFPRSKVGCDRTMLFQADAINFLSRNNFDFNKMIQTGVSFSPLASDGTLRQQIVNKLLKIQPQTRHFTCLSEQHSQQLDQMMSKIEEFVYDPSSGSKLIFQVNSNSLKKALSKQVTKVYMNTGIFTEFQRQLPQVVVKKSKQFKQKEFCRGYANQATDPEKIIQDLGFAQVSDQKEAELQSDVTMQSPQATAKSPSTTSDQEETKTDDFADPKDPFHQLSGSNQEVKREATQLFESERGFTRVIELLAASKKPLIGHHMSLDLAFLTNQFIDFLPSSFTAWRNQIIEKLPNALYDTKVISNFFDEKANLSMSNLEYLTKKCLTDKKFCNNIQVEPAGPQFTYAQKQLHDAGYDAYLTGIVFASLVKFIEIGQVISSKQKHFQACQNRPLVMASVQAYQHRVMLNIDTSQCYELREGLEPLPGSHYHQEHIKTNCLQVQVSPQPTVAKEWSVADVSEVFRQYGDVTIWKQSKTLFWIDYEEFSSTGSLKELIEQVEKAGQFKVLQDSDIIRYHCKP